MRQRRAAVRQLVYSSAAVIAKAGVPERAAADTFEDAMPEGAGAWVCRPREADGRDETSTGLTLYEQTDKGITGRQPLGLERRPLIEQTAPADDDDSLRRLRIDVEAGLIDLYLDDIELNERPIPAERVITDVANVDVGHIGEAGTARRRVSTTSSMSSAE